MAPAATAAYVPNTSSTGGGATTRTIGAGRSECTGLDRLRPAQLLVRDAVQLLEMHQVVHTGEEQPVAAAQPPDQRVIERAGLGLVSGELLGCAFLRAPALLEKNQ